jgi:hypothetical protein
MKIVGISLVQLARQAWEMKHSKAGDYVFLRIRETKVLKD